MKSLLLLLCFINVYLAASFNLIDNVKCETEFNNNTMQINLSFNLTNDQLNNVINGEFKTQTECNFIKKSQQLTIITSFDKNQYFIEIVNYDQNTNYYLLVEYMNDNVEISEVIYNFKSSYYNPAAVNEISVNINDNCSISSHFKREKICFNGKNNHQLEYNITKSYDEYFKEATINSSIVLDNCNLLSEYRKKNGLNISIQTKLSKLTSEVTFFQILSDRTSLRPRYFTGVYNNKSYKFTWENPLSEVEITKYKIVSCEGKNKNCNDFTDDVNYNGTTFDATIKSEHEDKIFAIATYSKNEQSELFWPTCNESMIEPSIRSTSRTTSTISIKWELNCEYIYNIESIQLYISTNNDTHFNMNCLSPHNVAANQTEFTFTNLKSETEYYINIRAKLFNQTCMTLKKLNKSTSNINPFYYVLAFLIFLIIVALVLYCIIKKIDSLKNERNLKEASLIGKALDLVKFRKIEPIELKISGEELGRGNFGMVNKAYWKDPDTRKSAAVAVKELFLQPDVDISLLNQQVVEESRTLCSMRDINIVGFIGICYGITSYKLVIELMPNGDLIKFMKNNDDKIGSLQLLTWASQIINGLSYIFSKINFHGDLAARNIFVRNSTQVLIGDFGMADFKSSNPHVIFPHRWTAPEVFDLTHTLSAKSDIWSLGVLLWELFSFCEEPYGGDPPDDSFPLLEQTTRMTFNVYEIILDCMKIDPESRLKLSEIKAKLTEIREGILCDSEDKSILFPIINDKKKNKEYKKLLNSLEFSNSFDRNYENDVAITESSSLVPSGGTNNKHIFENAFIHNFEAKPIRWTRIKMFFFKFTSNVSIFEQEIGEDCNQVIPLEIIETRPTYGPRYSNGLNMN